MKAVQAFLLDVVLVLVFVVIGRRNHHEATAAAGVVRTAAPFLIAIVAGWAAVRAWVRPTALRTGAVVWIVTVALGLALRRLAFHYGIAAAFIVVATLFNAFTLVGWRFVLMMVRRNAGPAVR